MLNINIFSQKKLLVFFLIFFFSLAFSAMRAGQDINYDQLNYHYYNCFALLHWRYWQDVAPAQTEHSYLNPLIYLPWYAATTLIGPRVATFVQCLLQACLIFPVVGLIRIAGRTEHDEPNTIELFFATIVALASSMIWSEAGTSFSDVILSIPVLYSLYFLLKFYMNINKEIYFWVSGASLGVAIGLKLTCMIYEPALILVSFIVIVRKKITFRSLVLQQIFLGVGVFITSGWLFLLCAIKFGNPIFPYFNGVFHSSEGARLSYMDRNYVPHTILQGVSYPFLWAKGTSVTSELNFRDICPVLALFVMIVFFICWALRCVNRKQELCVFQNRKSKALGLCVIFFGVTLLVWTIVFSIQRYFVGGVILAGIIVSCALIQMLSNKIRYIALAAMALLTVVTVQKSDWGHGPWLETSYDVVVPTPFRDADVVFLAGEPFSFISAFFQPAAEAVVMVKRYHPSSGNNTPISRQIKKSLEKKNAKIVVVADDKVDPAVIETIAGYGFSITDECVTLGGVHRAGPLRVCMLMRNL